MRAWSEALAVCCASLVALSASGQSAPTGSISGIVRDPGRLPLPGVVVSVSSPNLQGTRSATTSTQGDYIIAFLPAGDYKVTFGLSGFATVTRAAVVELAGSTRLDARMELENVQETVNVVAASEPISTYGSVATTHRTELVDRLPTDRTLEGTVMLGPGVSATGAAGKISVAGGMAYENLYLVNGVVVNENLRGQPLPLYVEDALQETRTTTAGVSAEYGRFAGGVVNTVTKSGGNQFSGSLRATFTNDRWRAVSPFGEPRTNRTIPTGEFTLGGPIWRDRIWFFTAARTSRPIIARQLPYTNVAYDYTSDERRLEGKLTASFARAHTLRLAYHRISQEETNATSGPVMDLRSVDDRNTRQGLLSLNYTGVLRSNFFVEGQYSRRQYTAYSGAQFTDLVNGTQLRDVTRSAVRYWAPSLCAVCGPDERDNQDILVKASYYRSTRSAGTHALVFGYDVFDDKWRADSHRTGSDWTVTGSSAILVSGTDTIYPVLRGDGTTLLTWNPILQASLGNRYRTHSVFANDQWRLGRFTFNLGVRWDKNDGQDASGTTVVRDQGWSPRLSASWDLSGTGTWVASASFARYVAAISNGIASGGSTAGSPATFTWPYAGPAINIRSPYVTPDLALPTLFAWFTANNIASTQPASASIPGVDTQLSGSLRSPSTWELSAGLSGRLGKVTLRTDVVRRRASNFYSTRIDATTGSGIDSGGRRYDQAIIENTNDVSRAYTALIVQATYRPHARLSTGGNWTLSSTFGNFDGESAGLGPMTADVHAYPEYKAAAWNYPTGHLAADQRHTLRAWAAWQLPVAERWGEVDVSVLELVASGTPYGAVGAIDMRSYVANPGYATPQGGTSVAYYFTSRDAFVTEASVRTDMALAYSHALRGRTRAFLQVQVLNLFNQSALENVNYLNKTVYSARTNPRTYAPFNALSTTPVQGVHWDLGPQFGLPTDARAYTLPRTFRFSAGIRF